MNARVVGLLAAVVIVGLVYLLLALRGGSPLAPSQSGTTANANGGTIGAGGANANANDPTGPSGAPRDAGPAPAPTDATPPALDARPPDGRTFDPSRDPKKIVYPQDSARPI